MSAMLYRRPVQVARTAERIGRERDLDRGSTRLTGSVGRLESDELVNRRVLELLAHPVERCRTMLRVLPGHRVLVFHVFRPTAGT